MTTLQIGRLILGGPVQAVSEQVGDPVGQLGGAVVSAPRTPSLAQIQLATILGSGGTLAQGQALRRKLRALLGNTPLKQGGFLYVVYSDDLEQNGWYVPDQTTLAGADKASWLATGLFQTGQTNWFIAGRQRTHREARRVQMLDLRTGQTARDFLGWILSADFSALPALPLTTLPNGATSVSDTVTGGVLAGAPLATGRDGGQCQLVEGLTDLTVLAYERAESALNLSDVIVYDRRGQITAPSTGPDTSWEEVYGSDYPWNWLTSAQPHDTPVLDNGLVRVRYDATTGVPGFRVDVWSGSAYVEQGKLTVERVGDSTGYCNTWVSAGLVEWTPERAVLRAVLANSTDVNSRELVFITVQRGETGATFECYPAPKAAGAIADAVLTWTTALADTNDSVVKVDSQTQPPPVGNGVIGATAGSGSAAWPSVTTLGAGSFASSENYLAILRCSAVATLTAYQTSLVVAQAAVAAKYLGTDTSGYGSAQNAVQIVGSGGLGYVQAQAYFAATQAQQVLEAESMTLGTGTTNTTDAAASNGHAATATRTTDANAHTTQATWPNGMAAIYRVFARVKVSANSASFYAKTGATTGTTRAGVNNTTYAWVDLGEITANNSTLEIHAWMSGGAGTVSVDRIEAVLTQDRTRSGAVWDGARDQGQAALMDSRQLGAIVAR